MASTFTGLKLQGQLGKFGRTEISDIHGYVELPDGKVLSGSEWGNMLLWDGGLIKVQISRKGRKPCHVGDIEQFTMDEGELITVGADGFVRVSRIGGGVCERLWVQILLGLEGYMSEGYGFKL